MINIHLNGEDNIPSNTGKRRVGAPDIIMQAVLLSRGLKIRRLLLLIGSKRDG